MTDPSTYCAQEYAITPDDVIIDGKPVPWFIHSDGPRVQSLGPDDPCHILWLPVLVRAPLPALIRAPMPGTWVDLLGEAPRAALATTPEGDE